MTANEELAEKLEVLCRESLQREFGDSIIFGPIIAGPVERGEGRATVTVTILFEGDARDLDAGRAAATLNAAVRPLLELGLQALPEWSFVPEHEHSPRGRMPGEAPQQGPCPELSGRFHVPCGAGHHAGTGPAGTGQEPGSPLSAGADGDREPGVPRAPRFPSCLSESTGPYIPSHREGCEVRSPECTGPFRWSSTGSCQSGGHISGRL